MSAYWSAPDLRRAFQHQTTESHKLASMRLTLIHEYRERPSPEGWNYMNNMFEGRLRALLPLDDRDNTRVK